MGAAQGQNVGAIDVEQSLIARAVAEHNSVRSTNIKFGAVNVVTQNSTDTNTVPLQIQNMYDGFQIPGAFALSTLLAMMGLVTLVAKTLLEWKIRRDAMSAIES